MTPAVELMAANLTLCLRNKGNRCYANSVLRMWCWMGAHHSDPAAFWGQSKKLCLQLLQQDEIEDVFWASELQPAIARLENPQQQHDASEFLVHLWELWGQTGLSGTWHSYFGMHGFETVPIFVRMPPDHPANLSVPANDFDWSCSTCHICAERSDCSSRSGAHQWTLCHNDG